MSFGRGTSDLRPQHSVDLVNSLGEVFDFPGFLFRNHLHVRSKVASSRIDGDKDEVFAGSRDKLVGLILCLAEICHDVVRPRG